MTAIRPDIQLRIPERDELAVELSAGNKDIDARIAYVLGLLRPAKEAFQIITNLETHIARLEEQADGYRKELKAYHEKYGDIDPKTKQAVDRAHAMRGQISRAQNAIDRLEAAMKREIADARASLAKPPGVR